MGLDILPGQREEGSFRRYFAAVILERGRVSKRFERLSLFKVFKVVKRERPNILALDNIFELHEDKKCLIKILSTLSLYTKVVQVTRSGEGEEKVLYLAKKVGILKSAEGKPSPLQTAEIVARLADKGVGAAVSVNENETRIVVCAGRTPGPGGMSSRRFQRNLSQLVLRATREIEESLRKHGIEYDCFVRKTEGGYKSSLFIVYAPREVLYGVIKQRKGYDIKILIKPVLKEDIEFVPLNAASVRRRYVVETPPQRHIIVGIDPGVSTGVAILTLDSNILTLFSARNLSRNLLVRKVLAYGKPVLVTTDVNPPPLYVRKIATFFNASIFYPPKSLSIEEKRKLAQEYAEKHGIKIADSHQRDALASAIKALGHFREKFIRAEKEALRIGIKVPLDEVKALIIQGKTVKEALEKVATHEKKPPLQKVELQKVDSTKSKEAEELKKKIKEIQVLKARIQALERELKEREKELLILKEEMEKLAKKHLIEYEKESLFKHLLSKIESLRKENLLLRQENEDLRAKIGLLKDLLEKALEGDVVRLIKIRDSDEFLEKKNSLRGRVIVVENLDDALRKAIESSVDESKPQGIIILNQAPQSIVERLEYYNIPVITGDEIRLTTLDDEHFVSKRELDEKLNRKLREIRERNVVESEDAIARIIKEYKSLRQRMLRLEE
ncbi:MAG: hypothetical protein DRJ51_03785 [Thermoprotei archaeon]|nr:MAG: hypothetical protein DRJ51_03785 [Thermoprotei archaeon]